MEVTIQINEVLLKQSGSTWPQGLTVIVSGWWDYGLFSFHFSVFPKLFTMSTCGFRDLLKQGLSPESRA